jgi:hypothetical protein
LVRNHLAGRILVSVLDSFIGLAKSWDLTLASTARSVLAVSKWHLLMADAIGKMEDEELTGEFLENH